VDDNSDSKLSLADFFAVYYRLDADESGHEPRR
jgi:hypothetical protein